MARIVGNFFRIALALVLAACATVEAYERQLQTFVGKPADRLVEAYGPPDKSYDMDDGRRVLQWRKEHIWTSGGFTRTKTVRSYTRDGRVVYIDVPYTEPERTHVEICVTRFFVDKDRKVTSWTHEGNACRAYDPD